MKGKSCIEDQGKMCKFLCEALKTIYSRERNEIFKEKREPGTHLIHVLEESFHSAITVSIVKVPTLGE